MKLVKNSLYSLFGVALPTIVAFVCIPFLIAKIGPERYGTLAIAWLLLGYFGAADFGIGRAITQRVSTLRKASARERSNAVLSALALMAAFGLLVATGIYLGADWYFSGPFEVTPAVRVEAEQAVPYLALCGPVVAINGVLSGALMGLERFRPSALATLVGNSGMLLLPLAAAYLISDNISLLVIACLLARLLAAAILAMSVWFAFFSEERASISKDEVHALTGFGRWIMLSALIGPLMVISDRFIIGTIGGAVAVAAYTIPFQIVTRALLVSNAFGQALYPRFATQGSEESLEKCSQYTAFFGQLFAIPIIVLICLSAPLLKLWLGHNLDPRSIPVAHILFAGIWVNGIAIVSYVFIQARGNPRFTGLLHTAELPIYILVLFILGKTYGLPGFACAFALRCSVDTLYLLRRAGIGWQSSLANLSIPGILIVASFTVGATVSNSVTLVTMAAALGGIAALALWWKMPKSIKQQLLSHPLMSHLRVYSGSRR